MQNTIGSVESSMIEPVPALGRSKKLLADLSPSYHIINQRNKSPPYFDTCRVAAFGPISQCL